jgi:hypothetical protein
MRRTDLILTAAFSVLAAQRGLAQIVSPPEIRDPQLRELQQKHLPELKAATASLASHQFPYHFYFSRTLDQSEDRQKVGDQRSIQFARFRDQTVLQVTGNYYAAYSAEMMSKEERARQTLNDVMLPILRATVSGLEPEQNLQSFALEIAHHVRKKVLGVDTEQAENVVLVLPKAAAARLVATRDERQQQAALQEGTVFVNGQPSPLWPRAETATTAPGILPPPRPATIAAKTLPPVVTPATVPATIAAPTPTAARPTAALQSAQQATIDRMVRDLDQKARFVGYAPPVFIDFHDGVYLQLSITSPLAEAAGASRYRVAAQAFDEHIVYLIRPVLSYFKDQAAFTGIDFSTSARTGEKVSLAVEYIFSLASLQCYAQFDCTGQQLIDSGYVLINGERVSLDLQRAEAGGWD